MRYIGVLDCNNFFVSCERLFRPDLTGKPVVVLSSNDGCVVARSKEVKDMGIPMGVPAFQLKDMVKGVDIHQFSSHFTLYRDISRRVFSVLKDIVITVEQYSIDEAFFIIEDAPESTIETQCFNIIKEVERAVGIPVSIGVSQTKTQAKYANRLAKQVNKPIVLTDKWWKENATSVKLQDIWGVGGQLLKRYSQAGMVSVFDIYQCPKPQLDSLFGIAGLRLQAELSGSVMHQITTSHELQKSVTSSRSFKSTSTDIFVLKDAVAYHVREATLTLRQQQALATVLQVRLFTSRYGDYFLRGGTLETYFIIPTNDPVVVMKEAVRLTERLFEVGVPYKKVGVTLSQLVPEGYMQGSLFGNEITPESKMLSKTIDELNNRFGRDTIQLGRHSVARQWWSKQENISPAYTTRWSDIATVLAT